MMIKFSIIILITLFLYSYATIEVYDDGEDLTISALSSKISITKDIFDVTIDRQDGTSVFTPLSNDEWRAGFGIFLSKDFTDDIYEGYSFRLGKQVKRFQIIILCFSVIKYLL